MSERCKEEKKEENIEEKREEKKDEKRGKRSKERGKAYRTTDSVQKIKLIGSCFPSRTE